MEENNVNDTTGSSGKHTGAIVAGVAFDRVVAETTVKNVSSEISTIGSVVVAVQRIVAGSTINGIITQTSVYDVITCTTVNNIVSGTSIYFIIACIGVSFN